jgi:trans-aconitate methyltransferase
MADWIWVFIILAGGFFILKIMYAFSIALVLPSTKGALYVSTSKVRIAAIMDAVPMNSDQLLVDLGCGDGRVLRAVWNRYGTKTIGYELNLLAYLKARLLCFRMRGVDIRLQNFWKADLSFADVVFCYLFPDVIKQLSEKLRSELKPGAVIVSCNFALPDLEIVQVLRPGNSLHNKNVWQVS